MYIMHSAPTVRKVVSRERSDCSDILRSW